MRKLVVIIILTTIYFLLPKTISGQLISGHSATMTYNSKTDASLKNSIIKKIVIRRVLDKYTSPLLDETDSFIKSCNNYNLDCYLLPSITGLESSFGRYIYPNSFNPFGWGGGYIMFDNWSLAINTVAKGLRENYINKGAETIEQIGPIYAESPTWAVRVKYFKNIFEIEEEKVSLLLGKNEVEL